MGLKGITEELYGRLVEAYRDIPGEAQGGVQRAAKAAGCDNRTARKGWEEGFARGWSGARRPIREVIWAEQEVARARLAQQQDEAQRKALEAEAMAKAETRRGAITDATDSRVEEGRVVRLLRGNALAALGNIARLNQALQKAVVSMHATVEDMVRPDPMTGRPRPLTPQEMRSLRDLVSATTTSLRQASDAASKAMECERLLLGEPTRIIGLQIQDLTWAEAQRRVDLAARAMARVQQRGLIVEGDNRGLTATEARASLAGVSPQGSLNTHLNNFLTSASTSASLVAVPRPLGSLQPITTPTLVPSFSDHPEGSTQPLALGARTHEHERMPMPVDDLRAHATPLGTRDDDDNLVPSFTCAPSATQAQPLAQAQPSTSVRVRSA